MRFTILASALVASVSVLAAPTDLQARSDLIVERQSSPSVPSAAAPAQPSAPVQSVAPIKPVPCVRDFSTTVEQTEVRSKQFAQAFIYKQDISKAFSFIAKDYINHNPSVKNGSDAAWEALSPFWNTAQLKPLRTAFQSPMSWVNYNSTEFGEIIDRFRWEGGCIVEHWDQNETFPAALAQKPSGKSCPSARH